MRAWVVVATAALFYTQACGSADFGDKINSPLTMTTDSSRSSAKSSVDSLKEQHTPVKVQQEKTRQETQNDILEVSKASQTSLQPAPSPQEKFQQNIAQNVNGLYTTGLEDNPFAALYEATRNAYVESSLNNFYSHSSRFQHPVNPFTEFNSRQNPYIDPVGTTFLAPEFPYVQPSPHIYQSHSNNRLPHPFQKNQIQETTFVGINTAAGQNNLDDYDDGSYDPYKYGDYVYFDDDYDSHNSKQPLAQSADAPPYQQHQSSHGNFIDRPSHNHQIPNHPQTQQKNHHSLAVSPAAQQQPQHFRPEPNNQQRVNRIHSNRFHNIHQPQKVHQPQQKKFQSAIVHHPVQENNAVAKIPKDASEFLDDSYSYQVEAAKQYLKEIEEQQEYAKKVLAASGPPAAAHQSSQFSVNDNFYNYHNEGTHPAIDGRYNNFPLESSHYQQTARPSNAAHEASESSTIKSHMNQQTSLESHQQTTGTDHPVHQPSEGSPTRSHPNQQTSLEGHYHQTAPAHQPSEVNSIRSQADQQIAYESNIGHFGGSLGSSEHEELHAGVNPSGISPVPTASPVLLPNGFLADTEEVRLAKIAHLQLVLDTLKTVSTYRRQYPKQRVVNAL